MKNTIEHIRNEFDVMMFRFRDGTTIVSTVQEDDEYFHLYNPLKLEQGIDQNRKEFAKLVRWYPYMVTESCRTIVPKDEVILFQVSESFQEYYVNRLEALNNPSKRKTTVLKIGDDKPSTETPLEVENNVISFDRFNAYRNAKNTNNLSVVSNGNANTGGNDVA